MGLIRLTNQSTTRTYAEFINAGSANLYHDNALKFNTTSTGIDVTGTVTADGLTVDADTATILDNRPSNIAAGDKGIIIGRNFDTPNRQVEFGGTFASFGQSPSFYVRTADKLRLKVFDQGDISFYEDTGTTAKFFWDASAESLGIGTSSPSEELSTVGNVNIGNNDSSNPASYLRFGATLYGAADIRPSDEGGHKVGLDFYTDGTGDVTVNPTFAMRIDSSGNLLVGTTDTTPYDNTSGNAIRIGDGLITSAQEGGNAAIFNRMLSDGSIVQFRKDGSTVGSIGSYSGVGMYAMAPNNGGSGLLFYDNAAPIYPISATIGDAYTDLGAAVHRFKDLYLSGGVYLGGTGSANKLDDYEEGTFTPTIKFGTNSVGQAYQIQNGFYTKVGRLVTFTLRVQFTNKGTSTGNAQIYGLPFSMQNATGANTGAYFGFVDNAGANWGSNNLTPTIDNGGNVINLRYVNTSGSYANFGHSDFNNTTDLIMGGQIFTA